MSLNWARVYFTRASGTSSVNIHGHTIDIVNTGPERAIQGARDDHTPIVIVRNNVWFGDRRLNFCNDFETDETVEPANG